MAFNPLMVSLVLLIIIVVLCCISSWYVGEQLILLSGRNQVPPNNSAGKGVMHVNLVNGDSALDYDIVVGDLTTPVTASHFHLGRAGENGPILVGVPLVRYNDNGKVIYKATGTWRFVNSETHAGNIINEIRNGNVYFNVHTERYPEGELRAQIHV